MVLCQGAEAAAVAPAAGKEPEGPQGREDGTDTGRPCLQPAAGVEAAGAEERRVCGCCPGWPWPRCCRAPGEEGEAGWQAEQGGSALSAGRRCRRGGGRGNGPEGSGAEWHAVAGRGVSPGGRWGRRTPAPGGRRSARACPAPACTSSARLGLTLTPRFSPRGEVWCGRRLARGKGSLSLPGAGVVCFLSSGCTALPSRLEVWHVCVLRRDVAALRKVRGRISCDCL